MEDTDLMDMSEDIGGGSYATKSYTGALMKRYASVRTGEVTVSAGEAGAGTKAVLFSGAFFSGTPVVLCVDNTGIVGLGVTSGESTTGFSVIVSNPGTFKYIAFLP